MRLMVCFATRPNLHHEPQLVGSRRRSVSATAWQAVRFRRLTFEAAAMIIATRVLKLRRAAGDIDIPIRILAPEQQSNHWTCTVEVEWPDGTVTIPVGGVDAMQSLELALKTIGVQIYASDHHASGKLMWLEPGKGYGFPVTNGIEDLLIGDDKKVL
jgi:hypothetical protein